MVKLMLTRRQNIVTAAFLTAVTCLGMLLLQGCVTPRHIDELKEQINEVKQQNRQTQQQVEALDSLVRSSSDADMKLRNDLRVTVEEMTQQMTQLLASYNDLMEVLHQIEAKQGNRLFSSSGSQSQQVVPPPTGGASDQSQGIDCGAAYDTAFQTMLGSDYEKAIDGFRAYIASCPKHESVENAYYWIGECYYSLQKYTEAVESFQFLVNTYKGSRNAPRAYYKLARSQQEIGKTAEAKKLYQKLVDDYPGELEAEQAKDRLKELK